MRLRSTKDAFLKGISTRLKNPCGKGKRQLIAVYIGSEEEFMVKGLWMCVSHSVVKYHEEMTVTMWCIMR
jgi:hypothetical protein